jgi:hypothetical protein
MRFDKGGDEQSKSHTEFVELYENVSDAYRQRLRASAAKWAGPLDDHPIVCGPTLHEALRDHIIWLKEEYTGTNGDVTAWGKVRIKQVEPLLDRHDDLLLASLDHDAVERFVRFWRQRPPRKGTDQPMAKESAEHQIAALSFFLRWLNRSTKYD